jgi:hypothetical protein
VGCGPDRRSTGRRTHRRCRVPRARARDLARHDQGQLIAEAIELVSPPFLRHDEQLLEQALALAVQMQADGKRQQAGALALAAVLIAALIALAFGSGE